MITYLDLLEFLNKLPANKLNENVVIQKTSWSRGKEIHEFTAVNSIKMNYGSDVLDEGHIYLSID